MRAVRAGHRAGRHTTRLLDQGRVAVLGSFDDVETAVRRTGADIVAVLACPEMDAPAMRRLSWRLERTGTDLMVAGARCSTWPAPVRPSGRSTGCR
ncbi:nucleoside-diphosphate sugar epimerase/dehydratase [Fodinicola feengrottensis]|uniref:nucleoside-diphosphate sugar epimerase/dehydratase n=1 Tax=Fodinicola feengrottensis TaxID=435914 RepID=UPI002441EBA0|nr:hypothetical protein [Fodinicola feengrottensis]